MAVESLLFAAGASLSLRQLAALVGAPPGAVKAALGRLRAKYAPADSGVHLAEVAGGYHLRTAAACADSVRRCLRTQRAQLSRAALETLALIAYRQPLTKGAIEAVRGVDVDAVLQALLTKKLVRVVGRKEEAGRPWVYGTTPEFLALFGLPDLASLPPLPAIHEPTRNPRTTRETNGAPHQGAG